jgi:hypothetical protein
MEQHPVPQQISSYQFRLVGDMTLKQFFQLAGGCLCALIVYASPLPAIFRWPLIVFFVLIGAAMAFLPIEERPLDVWIVAFFRAIYSPTKFYWKASAQPASYFAPEQAASATPAVPLPNPPANTSSNTPLEQLEESEKNFLSKVTDMFNLPTVQVSQEANQAPPTPLQPEVAKTIPVPVASPIKVEPQKSIYESTPKTAIELPKVAQTTSVAQTLTAQGPTTAAAATFSPEAAPPMPPTQANIVVGQVTDQQGKIVEGAILEIKDVHGRPVRALKTNKAGHFLIVTPLANGYYEIDIEKPGINFDKIKFEATGSIIEPMMIIGKQIQ